MANEPDPGARNSPDDSRWRPRSRPSGPPLPLWLVVLVVVVIGALVWWWLSRDDSDVDPMLEPAAPAAAPAPGSDEPPLAEIESLDLPPLGESDGIVARVVGTLSNHPRWAEWLVTDGLAQRFVGAVSGVAAGVSPAAQVPFLAPEGDFIVRSAGARTEIDPASYRRYDQVTEAFVSFDTDAAVRLYQQLVPLFEEAHRDLGFPEGSFGLTMATALDNLLAVSVADAPTEVELDVKTYLYTDPATEALAPAEKHLLRMGPDNAELVQLKLRALREGLVAAGAIPRR